MLSLLKVDFYKMFRTKSFYIIGLILSVLSALNSYFYAKMVLDSVNNAGNFVSYLTVDVFSAIFSNLEGVITYISLFAVLFMCVEFSNGTIKNIATKGYYRESIYLSKFISSIVGALIYVLFIAISSLLPYLLVVGNKDTKIYEMPKHFVSCFSLLVLYIVAYISLSLMIASLIRKSGISIFGVFVLPLIAGLVSVFDRFLKNVVETDFRLYDYTLSSNIYSLMDGVRAGLPSEDLLRVILIPVAFLCVSLAIGLAFFKNRDI